MANANLNATPNFQNKDYRSPEQLFSRTNVSINAKHYKPFGCPTYVLDKSLQTNLPFHKWKQRSRVGIYIGPSPQHARNVALVMDRATGLVSPQFHVKFDPSFQSVKDDNQPQTWQYKAGLVSQRESANAPMARQNQQLQPANAHDANVGAAEKVNGTTRPSAGAMASHGGNNTPRWSPANGTAKMLLANKAKELIHVESAKRKTMQPTPEGDPKVSLVPIVPKTLEMNAQLSAPKGTKRSGWGHDSSPMVTTTNLAT